MSKYNKLLNHSPDDVWSIVIGICKEYEKDNKKILKFVSELISFEAQTSQHQSKLSAINAIMNCVKKDVIWADNENKINAYYKKMINDGIANVNNVGINILSATTDMELISMFFKLFKCLPIFLSRSKEEILSIISNIDISKKIILGLLHGNKPYVYYENRNYDDPIDKEVYDCAYIAMEDALRDDNFLNGINVSTDIIKKIDNIIRDNNSFYTPYALAAKNILHKNNKLNIMGKDYIFQISDLSADVDYRKLNYAGDGVFMLYNQREKIITSTNQGYFRISKWLRFILGIKKSEINNPNSLLGASVKTINKENFNDVYRFNLKKLLTKEGSIDLINNDLKDKYWFNLEYIFEIMNDNKIFEDFFFEDFKKINYDRAGAFLSYLYKYFPDKAKEFLRKDSFKSLNGWSNDIIKPEEITESDLKKIISIFNISKEKINETIDYQKFINTERGRIFILLNRTNIWKKNLIKNLKSNDSIKWWLEGIKFIYNMDFCFPKEQKDIYTFINSCVEVVKPFKRFFENEKIWNWFIIFISDNKNNADISINFVASGIVWLDNKKSQHIINSILNNEKYEFHNLVNSLIINYKEEWKEKAELLIKNNRISLQAVKQLKSLISFQSPMEITNSMPEWLIKKILLTKDYHIMPYEVHRISYFLSESNFSDKEKLEIISKIYEPPENEIYRGISEDDLGIDGITMLLNSVDESTEQKILKKLRHQYKKIPFKFLSRLKTI